MVAVSFLLHYDTLLQNVTDIVSYFITKCDKSLLQKCISFLIRKYDSFIAKCNGYD